MKRSIITGIVLILPLAITFWIVQLLYKLCIAPFLHVGIKLLALVDQFYGIYLPLWIQGMVFLLVPAFALVGTLAATTLIGYLTRWYLGEKIVALTNKIFEKMPFFNKIYSAFKELFSTIFSPKKKLFKSVCLIDFPSKKQKTLGLVIDKLPELFSKRTKKDLVGVVILTAPHPLAGYLIYVPKELAHEADISVENAIRYAVSMGLIHPHETTTKELK
ncbi:MAG: hypothetical protein K940chlam8_01001 [Chlamydiae bacterium]|nr:hypothetical protein [Chlamydiota bacterium]